MCQGVSVVSMIGRSFKRKKWIVKATDGPFKVFPEEDGRGALDSSSELRDRKDAHPVVGQTNVLSGAPGAPSMEESHIKCHMMIMEVCVVEQKTPNKCMPAFLVLGSPLFC